MSPGDSETTEIGGLWRVAVLLSGWAFVFFTAPPFGAVPAGVPVVDAALAIDAAIVALSAWVLWVDMTAAASAGMLDVDQRASFAVVFLAYLVSIPFYTGYRLYIALK